MIKLITLVDASNGRGHLSRCVAIAHDFLDRGFGDFELHVFSDALVSCDLPLKLHKRSFLREYPYCKQLFARSADRYITDLPVDYELVDELIADHHHVAFIDELTHRPCVNQAIFANPKPSESLSGWGGTLDEFFVGIGFGLSLRWRIADPVRLPRYSCNINLLVYLGSNVRSDLTLTILNSLEALGLDLKVTVLDSKLTSHKIISELNVKYLDISVRNYFDDPMKGFAGYNLAVGALGTSQWQRMALGIYTFFVPTALNQLIDSDYLSDLAIGQPIGAGVQVLRNDLDEIFQSRICADLSYLEIAQNFTQNLMREEFEKRRQFIARYV